MEKIILMKVGPYCGYSLDEIIKIKQNEELTIGKYYWGYSGVFCHPYVVQNLLNYDNTAERVRILFVETKSKFNTENVERFEEFSKDKNIWKKLNENVLLVGKRTKPHFAIVGKYLKKVDFRLNLAEYYTLKGFFVDENQSFDKYFKYRVDKACGIKAESVNQEKYIDIIYESELVYPYCVYIR